ncbi:MAG TPA: alpha/beta hydrolase [Povalibacter sp.]|uniref:alpha/beta hydrolase n=1 Tax=Povalibacter sp. TaxID=1962978 RepID=UPI002CA6A226|nr:alpha/beta hydrolase [Povalibacter sp.]HMN45411.1 alpha/beta hydrolase [Povalibacter sp.]
MRSAKILLALGLACGASAAMAQDKPFQFAGAPCVTPPPLHCPDKDCSGDRVINPGNVVEMKTRRTYFLDYPCDLKPGEKVTFVLSLHGGGSYGNWQRHYFPLLDYKDKYRLVIATPNSPTRAWSPADDEYLQNIVTFVYDQIGKDNVKAFWLAGHSQGGQTSNRLLQTDFFREKLTGWVSLSGGRLGSKREDIRATIPGTPPAAAGAPRTLAAYAENLPDYPFSHIYEAGEHEYTAAGVPKTSPWAEKLQCGKREQRADIVDTQAGYVFDGSGTRPPSKIWGLQPGPGTAQVYVYPDCADGRVVADIVRLGKGHTEGLEPHVTEEIVKLMLSAR